MRAHRLTLSVVVIGGELGEVGWVAVDEVEFDGLAEQVGLNGALDEPVSVVCQERFEGLGGGISTGSHRGAVVVDDPVELGARECWTATGAEPVE